MKSSSVPIFFTLYNAYAILPCETGVITLLYPTYRSYFTPFLTASGKTLYLPTNISPPPHISNPSSQERFNATTEQRLSNTRTLYICSSAAGGTSRQQGAKLQEPRNRGISMMTSSMEFPGSLNKWYISGIYCQLGDYISPTTYEGTKKQLLTSAMTVKEVDPQTWILYTNSVMWSKFLESWIESFLEKNNMWFFISKLELFNDPCFGFRPCFGWLTFKNRGHGGSRNVYYLWHLLFLAGNSCSRRILELLQMQAAAISIDEVVIRFSLGLA